MAIGNSHEYPKRFASTRGVVQFRYNITKSIKVDMNGESHPNFDFEYVEVARRDRGTLIDAIISTRYSKDIELARINNELASPGTPEYAEYQAFRTTAKQIVDEALA